MKNKSIIVGLVIACFLIVLGVIGSYFYLKINYSRPAKSLPSFQYTCAQGKTLLMSFTNKEMTKVMLQLDDNRKLELDQKMTASGTRYTNSDQSIAFWSQADTTFLSEKGTDTYANCVQK